MAVGSRCKSCTEPILFVRTANGGRMPVDLVTCKPEDDENTLFDPARHRSHFATCPQANEHRKRRHPK